MRSIVLVLAVAALAAHPLDGTPKGRQHDGHWWLSISREQRESYLLGYYDCYVGSLRQPRPPLLETGKEAELVLQAYRSDPSRLPALASDVMKDIWAANPRGAVPIRPKGGERATGPHGFFDGLWWKGASEAEKLGFVEGEMDCFNQEGPSKYRLGLSANHYVKWLDRAYGLDESSDESTSRALVPEEASIADVLLKDAEPVAGQ